MAAERSIQTVPFHPCSLNVDETLLERYQSPISKFTADIANRAAGVISKTVLPTQSCPVANADSVATLLS